MIDFLKLQKGAKVRLKDGRVVAISGLYLSGSGPCLMVKNGTSAVNENVPVDQVTEIVEG